MTDDAAAYAARGLLDGLEGRARDERVALLRWLEEQGVPDEAIARSTSNGTILLTAAGVQLGTAPRYSAWEVADVSGVEVELLLQLTRASGWPSPVSADESYFGEVFLELAHTVRRFLDAGLTDERMIAIARTLGLGLGQAAEAMRATVLEIAIEPGLSELQLARSYEVAASSLLPMVGPLLDQMLRLHLHNAVRDEVVTNDERAIGQLPGARDVAVAFADLVGFTKLGEQVPPDQLEQVADQLVTFAAEVLAPPVRLIKSVGDAVLLVSPDSSALLDVSFDLLERVEQEGAGFPQVRIGLAYGAAVSRSGDWFGRPVNLASRITGVARAGSVVSDDAFKDELDGVDGVLWSRIGDRRLKGFQKPVELHRARRPSSLSSKR